MSEEKERVAKYRAVYVTEITDTLHFYTQDVETGNGAPCLASCKTSAPVSGGCQRVRFLSWFYSLERHTDFMSLNYRRRSDIHLIPGRRRPPSPSRRPNKGRPVCYRPRMKGINHGVPTRQH